MGHAKCDVHHESIRDHCRLGSDLGKRSAAGSLDPSISLLIMCDLRPAARARARAMQATAREIEAHRRAINLQESSAIMLDRAHQTDKSRNARERAGHAREMLWRALAELEALRKAS